ncbi:hypothetical protein [Nocardiopsis nanhaiensis]
MMVTFCSLSGAPGVTTAALALASTWPADAAVRVVEADASGGDIAAWWHLPVWPGLTDLAAANRPGQDHDHPGEARFLQVLPGGVRVCLAPASAERTASALDLITQHPKALTRWAGVTLVDLGRVAPEAEVMALAEEAQCHVVFTSGDLAHLKRLKDTLTDSVGRDSRLGVVVVGPGRSAQEVQQAVGVPVWGHLPWDPTSAAVLAGRRPAGRRLHRRPLIKAAQALGRTLADSAPPRRFADPVQAFLGGRP